MELIERDDFLSMMQKSFDEVITGDGHCILISGEAGIGKTSLVRAFSKKNKDDCQIYFGSCDALFTPRPLAPIYDIALQIRDDKWHAEDRSNLFVKIFHELENQKKATLIIVEDIHWADEATFDFLKFFIRRITRLHCLLLVTYRENEIHSTHPLRAVLGQLPPDFFTRLQLTPLSRGAVETMAAEKGYKGKDVYGISGGNPFYVNEILASYSTGIPDNIKDSILSVYNRQNEKTKQVWQILSVIPTGLEAKYLEKLEPYYSEAIHDNLDTKILIKYGDMISFKHELYRRTIETSLSPITRRNINKRMLDILVESGGQSKEMERIIHHAKNASENEIVVEYAPLAARHAALVGAHIEAARLFHTAIEYYQGKDKDLLVHFYESYAYECYLTNQIKEAIIFSEKCLHLVKQKNDLEKHGACLRFLSRLWWFEGNTKKAETYAKQAIEVLDNQPSSKAKAMALSNMSQLKMLSDERDECRLWGEKAIAMAKELADEDTLSHALNNVGMAQMRAYASRQKGFELLQQSLEIALKNSHEDNALRAYINMGSNAVVMKDFLFAKKILNEGIQYCEERDLDLGTLYLLSFKARLCLETGDWNEAERISAALIKNDDQPAVVKIGALYVLATVKMRRGSDDVLSLLLEAKEKTLETMEPQRIVPVMSALLEHEWITGKSLIEKAVLDDVLSMIKQRGNINENSGFAFWLLKVRNQQAPLREIFEGYTTDNPTLAVKAANLWKKLGCPYEEALALFNGGDNDKKKALGIIQKLGAGAIYEKMKFEMRASGIKSIPRGVRKSTQSNRANLTSRELDILQLLKAGLQNKEIAAKLFISPKTVDHHISSIFFKLDVNSRTKAVQEASRLEIIK
ncbi:MAG TPA: LuxR C-terminal-related transcriptional regulator [Chitinophagaceae bacterium]|jgi:DNA-binding CsgD family transcriptional regulator|nr:LuxR C-terminal-related transcriptional regulator [Chitinophagaceae bacterium]